MGLAGELNGKRARAFIEAEARCRASSLTSEVIRCIRHRTKDQVATKPLGAELVACPQEGRSSDG